MDEPGSSDATIQAEPVRQDVGGSSSEGLDVSQPEPVHTEEGEPTEVSAIEVSTKLSRGPFNGDTTEGHRRSKRAHKALDY